MTREIEFIQYDVPPLSDGVYTVTVTVKAGLGDPDDFGATTTFAVSGERFTIDPAEIAGVFPPDLANGEYAGVLPHVLLRRRTLPWEREAQTGVPGTPWLAVLLLDEDEVPALQQLKVKDLVPAGKPITVTGSTVTGVGKMPAGTVSSPGLTTLEYGEAPEDPVQVIDLPAATFSAVAPSIVDLPFLGHIRKVDTTDTVDAADPDDQLAVVLGNRIAADTTGAHALLVSLEGLAPILPAADGTPNPALTASKVRLTVFRAWRFFANTGGETFLKLLEGLNAPPDGQVGPLTSLQVPFAGDPPTAAQVQQARANQAGGQLASGDARVLAHDAFGMGYLPLGHHLRHGGQTVSWYRGPLAPLPVIAEVTLPLAGPDAATRYDAQTGMFDVSYAAAWQLGQLMAVQARAFALAVVAWRRGLRADDAVAAEQTIIEDLLSGAFDSVVRRSAAALQQASGEDGYPQAITDWLAKLRLLVGVPFNYLAPDERMLPPESLRTFHVDPAWMDALLDGALSIGRATTGELAQHAEHADALHAAAFVATRSVRANPLPETNHVNAEQDVSGFLLRSQVVGGWPRLSVKGYSDTAKTTEIPKLRMERLSQDVLLVLFDGVLADFEIREAPEQLHSGVEEASGQLSTTLREVVGDTPGRQYLVDPKGGSPDALVPARGDQRTLLVSCAAANIHKKLNTDFSQGLTTFTSAEFALEMVKGVGDVEFRLGG